MGPVSVTGTLFASNIDHPVYVDRGSTYDIVNLLGPTRNRGAELLATWRKSPFSVTANYTYVRSTELEPILAALKFRSLRGITWGSWGCGKKRASMRIGLECYYTGTQRLEYNPYRDSPRPILLVGAMAERKIAAHVKLFINLENLTNVRQTRWDPLLLPSRASDGQMDGGCLGASRWPSGQRRRSFRFLARVHCYCGRLAVAQASACSAGFSKRDLVGTG